MIGGASPLAGHEHGKTAMPTTRTLEDGRLFPPLTWDHGWTLSLQADKAGYACSPRERLPHLEDYDSVEARLEGPFPHPVDPATLGLPEAVLAKFSPLEGNGASLGSFLTRDDVEAVKAAILQASLNPNAGVPRGRFGWSGRTVYHGTSVSGAEAIRVGGVDMAASSGGYFGHGFYVTDDLDLALSNYAGFNDEDDAGAVVEFVLADDAPILDLRNAEDAKAWTDSGLDGFLGRRELPARARGNGIAGVYDRSMGGLVVFDVAVLGDVVKVHGLPAPGGAPAPR
jgi:hypothetical protein